VLELNEFFHRRLKKKHSTPRGKTRLSAAKNPRLSRCCGAFSLGYKALNLVVVGSSPTVGASTKFARLPQGKSPGPSGLRAEHLQGANQRTMVALIRVLRQLATAPENFSSPLTRALRSSRLLPFAKPQKEADPPQRPGVRPIGVPEVLRKIATQWTPRAVIDRVRELLVPLQLGIGVSGGCERALHVIQAHLACKPDAVVLRLDLENAFNRIDRRIAKRLVEGLR